MRKRLRSDRPAPVWRAGRAGAALALVALAVSGCMSLKENKVVQTTPGKVTIRTVVCASNYAANKECGPGNLFAGDNNRADATAAKTGQMLVGFRVPVGAEGPAGFSTKNPAVAFTKSDSYAAEMRRLFPPLADQQWIGYISAVGDFKPAGPRVLEIEPEFTLPASAAGRPFRWRTVIGFREGSDAAAPVSCPQPDPKVANLCVESPADIRIQSDEANAVSDFALLGGGTTTVFPGTTAVVPFKLAYADAAHLGKQSFSLSARTALPRTSARIAAQVLANPDSNSDVEAEVPVPTNTPAGRYSVALTGAIGAPAVTRAATGTIVVEPVPQLPNKPAPLPAVGRVKFGWLATRSGGMKFTRLLVTGAPARGTVTVRCRGGGCPRGPKPIKHRPTVNLSGQFRGRALRPHAIVTIRITEGNRIAKEIGLTVRGPRAPATKVRCRPPGAKKTLPCQGVSGT